MKRIMLLLTVALLLCTLLPGCKSQPETTEPSQTETQEALLTYEQYQALSGEEQMEYYNSFESAEDFFAWRDAAVEEYESNQNMVKPGETIDLESIVNGNK